jgi:hypothetical protein
MSAEETKCVAKASYQLMKRSTYALVAEIAGEIRG